jgi:hypothetical protein
MGCRLADDVRDHALKLAFGKDHGAAPATR